MVIALKKLDIFKFINQGRGFGSNYISKKDAPKNNFRDDLKSGMAPDTVTRFMTLFFVLGIITGSILNPIGYSSAADSVFGGISNYDMYSAQVLRISIMTLLPFAAAMLCLSLFAAGWAVIPLVIVFRGFELGVFFRHIYVYEGFSKGALFVALALLPGAVLSGAALITMAAASLSVSLGIFSTITRRSIILDMSALLRGFALKFAALCLLLAGSALLDVIFRKIYFLCF